MVGGHYNVTVMSTAELCGLLEVYRRELPERGPVALSEEYLALVRRIENTPQNRSGADKSWLFPPYRAALSIFARVERS